MASELLMRPAHAAKEAGVTTHTLANYADAGNLTVRRTAGGHRRYLAREIAALAHQAALAGQADRGSDGQIPGQLELADALEGVA